MRYFLCLYILTFFVCCTNPDAKKQETEIQKGLTEQQILQHLSDRNDSTTWDMEMFKRDLNGLPEKESGPFTAGIFPEPKYNLIGKESFDGVGSFGITGSGKNYKKIKDKKILYNSFYVKENSLNRKRLEGKPDEIFFQILVLTDSIDVKGFTHMGNQITSRNHPDYMGQGYYYTKNNRIDYSAFITIHRNSFAIVNSRLFNLEYGKTILIAPQKDGSLRSLQLNSPKMSSSEVDDYTDELLASKLVTDFFTSNKNI